ncbi:hypothetical protein DY942_24160 [Pseudomonas aeruginosa]|nr:hypothetical protein DY942_24160 [Pseudomonas aeruginosa]
MTRMQVRRNTDFTGWPSTEGQTGSQRGDRSWPARTILKPLRICCIAENSLPTKQMSRWFATIGSAW